MRNFWDDPNSNQDSTYEEDEIKRGLKCLLVGVLGLTLPCWALTAPIAPGQNRAGQSLHVKQEQRLDVTVQRGPEGKKTFVFKKIDLVGKHHRPNAFYILSRTTVRYDWTTMKKRFLPRISASV